MEKNVLDTISTKSEMLSETIKQLLIYVGFASAIISSTAYIIVTIVMVKGFNADFSTSNQIVFSVLGAIVGLTISFSLRNQGIAFAKRNEKAQEVMKRYYKALNKTKKEKELRTIQDYLIRATIIDIIVKGTIVIVSTFFILYIFIEGDGNYALVGLAVANIFMFIGFGLVALSKSYDVYLEEHIPVIEELTSKLEQQEPKEKALD